MNFAIQTEIFEKSAKTVKFIKENNQAVIKLDSIQESKNYFFRGSIENALKFKNKKNIEVWFDEKKYDFLNYADQFKSYLLNKNYGVFSVEQFAKEKDKIQNNYGERDFITGNDETIVFARPNSGLKSFTGQIIGNLFWDAFVRKFQENEIDNIIISTPKTIKEEFRFVVFGNEVVTGSKYIGKENITYKEIKETESSFKFAETVVETTFFNPKNEKDCYILDVAKTENGFSVVELNAFSTSGLYECNRKKIFNKII